MFRFYEELALLVFQSPKMDAVINEVTNCAAAKPWSLRKVFKLFLRSCRIAAHEVEQSVSERSGLPARYTITHTVNNGPVNRANNVTLEQMTKQQLVDAVSEKTGQGKTEVEAVVDSILGTITEALSANERVDLRGFGSLVVKERKERQGRNPRTGETITIPAKRDVGFRVGKELSEKLHRAKPEPTPA